MKRESDPLAFLDDCSIANPARQKEMQKNAREAAYVLGKLYFDLLERSVILDDILSTGIELFLCIKKIIFSDQAKLKQFFL